MYESFDDYYNDLINDAALCGIRVYEDVHAKLDSANSHEDRLRIISDLSETEVKSVHDGIIFQRDGVNFLYKSESSTLVWKLLAK